MKKFIGIALGLTCALAVIGSIEFIAGEGSHTEQHSVPKRILSDCDGTMEHIVIQYVKEADEITKSVYRDLISQLPDDIRITLICKDQDDVNQFLKSSGFRSDRFEKVIVSHDMTCWSRDRWLALTDPEGSPGTTLLIPYKENAMERWKERSGDARIAYDIKNAYDDEVWVEKSNLLFDGGDFVCDKETVFVSPNVLVRNPGFSNQQIEGILERKLGKHIVLLANAREHHAGMYIMPISNKRVIVGDPKLAITLIKSQKGNGYEELLNALPKNIDDVQKSFDSIADTCKEHNYEIIRIPVLPYNDMRTYITPLNVIINTENKTNVVYMPVISGADVLNDYSEKVWESCGYAVKPVDCTSSYKYSGSLRCLVNVLKRN